jgi:hypothetical protein
VGVPEPAVFRNESVPPGVRLEDVLWREVQPASDGGTQMRRRVMHVPPVFVSGLNRLYEDSGQDGDGLFQVRETTGDRPCSNLRAGRGNCLRAAGGRRGRREPGR